MAIINPIGCSMEQQREAVRQLQQRLGATSGRIVCVAALPRPALRSIDPVNDTQVPSPALLAQMEARGAAWDISLAEDDEENDLDHDIEGDGGDNQLLEDE